MRRHITLISLTSFINADAHRGKNLFLLTAAVWGVIFTHFICSISTLQSLTFHDSEVIVSKTARFFIKDSSKSLLRLWRRRRVINYFISQINTIRGRWQITQPKGHQHSWSAASATDGFVQNKARSIKHGLIKQIKVKQNRQHHSRRKEGRKEFPPLFLLQ